MGNKDILKILATNSRSPFFIKNNFLTIRNVSWGFFPWGEADILSVTRRHYLIEGEIKISIKDLRKDFKKKKWQSTFEEVRNSGILCVMQNKIVLAKKPSAKNKIVASNEEILKLARLSCLREWDRINVDKTKYNA